MLEQELKKIVPDEINKFNKLKSGDPYFFGRWGNDLDGSTILYYWFYSKDKSKKNQKRVFLSEVDELLRTANENKAEMINRKMFKKQCPKTNSDGPCGFALIIRLLESLGIAEYTGNVGAKIINRGKINELIGD